MCREWLQGRRDKGMDGSRGPEKEETHFFYTSLLGVHYGVRATRDVYIFFVE